MRRIAKARAIFAENCDQIGLLMIVFAIVVAALVTIIL